MGSSLVLNRRPKAPAEDTSAFGAIAERFRRGGALEQAVSLCRDGLKKFPDHVSARVTLGWALLDLGKYEEARVELEQVMRRAPDNLAAIRGLAELHDRFEHTLNLSMDGPGAWPPPADVLDDAVASTGDGAVSYDDGVVAMAPTMAPADLGLPLWSPEPAAASVVEAVANTQIQTPASGMSSVREIDAFAAAQVPVIEQPEEAPVAEAPVSLSSVEEADLGVYDETLAALIAEADSLDAVAELEVAAAPSAAPSAAQADAEAEVEAPVVAWASTDAIELESSETVEFAAVEDQPIELAQSEAVELATAETFELDSAAVEIEMEPVVFEPAAVVIAEPELSEPEIVAIEIETDEEQAVAFVEPPVVAEAEPQMVAEAEPQIVAEAESQMVAEAEPQMVAEAEPQIVAEVEPQIVAEVEPQIVAEVEPQIVAEVEPQIVAEVEPQIVAEVEPQIIAVAEPQFVADVESEIVVLAEPEVVAEAEPEPEFAVAAMVETPDAVAGVAEILAFVRSEVPETPIESVTAAVSAARRSGEVRIVALERMLRRVQARRLELMAESVA